jgi:hypothetical protein
MSHLPDRKLPWRIELYPRLESSMDIQSRSFSQGHNVWRIASEGVVGKLLNKHHFRGQYGFVALHDCSQGFSGSEVHQRHRARSLPRIASRLIMSTGSVSVRGSGLYKQQLHIAICMAWYLPLPLMFQLTSSLLFEHEPPHLVLTQGHCEQQLGNGCSCFRGRRKLLS